MERPSHLHRTKSIPSPGEPASSPLLPFSVSHVSQAQANLSFCAARESSLHDLETIIAPLVSIPSFSLIIMHRSGWQVDESLLPLLLSECRSSRQSSNSPSTSTSAFGGAPGGVGDGNGNNETFVSALVDLPEIFIFDRTFLDAPVEELLSEWEISERGVLGDLEVAESWSPRELEDKALELLARIRNQRRALDVALSNLDRHKEGKQGGVEAFEVGKRSLFPSAVSFADSSLISQLFASPLLASYRALINSYPLSFWLAKKVQVHPLLLSQPNVAGSTTSGAPTAARRQPSIGSGSVVKEHKERYLGDYVSKEKIENCKEKCKKVFGTF
jgi:autophagy-related protein 11